MANAQTLRLATLENNYQNAMAKLEGIMSSGTEAEKQAAITAAVTARQQIVEHIAASNANGAKNIAPARAARSVNLINSNCYQLNLGPQSVFTASNGEMFNASGYFYTAEERTEIQERARQNILYNENRTLVTEREDAHERIDPEVARQEIAELRQEMAPQRNMRRVLAVALGATALIALGPVGLGVGGVAAAALTAGGGAGFAFSGIASVVNGIRNRRNLDYQMDRMQLMNARHAIVMVDLQQQLEKETDQRKIEKIKADMQKLAESQIKQNLKFASRASALKSRLERQERRNRLRLWRAAHGKTGMRDRYNTRLNKAQTMIDFANQNIAQKLDLSIEYELPLGACASAVMNGKRAGWFSRNVWMSNNESGYEYNQELNNDNQKLYQSVLKDTITRDAEKYNKETSFADVREGLIKQCGIEFGDGRAPFDNKTELKMAIDLYNSVPGIKGTNLGNDIMQKIVESFGEGGIAEEMVNVSGAYDPEIVGFYKEHIDEIAPKPPQKPEELKNPGDWTGGPKKGKAYLEWKSKKDAFDARQKQIEEYDTHTEYAEQQAARDRIDATMAGIEKNNPNKDATRVQETRRVSQADLERAAREVDAGRSL